MQYTYAMYIVYVNALTSLLGISSTHNEHWELFNINIVWIACIVFVNNQYDFR